MTTMPNPYKAIGTAFVTGVLAGASTEAKSRSGTLAERLQNYAFYMTEQQQDPGDALLVIDLHDVFRVIRDARELATGILDLQVGCLDPDEMRCAARRIIAKTS